MATKCNSILLVSRNIEQLNAISKRLLSSANSSTIGVCNKWKNSSDGGLLQQAAVSQNVFCQNKLAVSCIDFLTLNQQCSQSLNSVKLNLLYFLRQKPNFAIDFGVRIL